MRRVRPARYVVLLAGAVALAACGSQVGPGGLGTSGPDPAQTTTTVTASSPATGSGEVAVVEVLDDVSYYGACGNELLTIGARTLYPLLPDERERLDDTAYPEATGTADGDLTVIVLAAAAPRVPAPSSGDDVGTLVVFSDGMARFSSDSGKFDIWLTDEVRGYNWVC